jgi:hypothetical protein
MVAQRVEDARLDRYSAPPALSVIVSSPALPRK